MSDEQADAAAAAAAAVPHGGLDQPYVDPPAATGVAQPGFNGETPAGAGLRGRRIRMVDMGPVSRLKGFDIRNGPVSEAKSLLVRATIARSWHWGVLRDLDPRNAIAYMQGFILQELARLTLNPETGVSPEVRRKKAICIGVCRAVSTELYRITSADLIVGEAADPVLGIDREGCLVVLPETPQNWVEELGKGFVPSELELRVMARIHLLSVGMLPLQGYSLIMTNHHYVSSGENQSRKAFAVVEKQIWTGASTEESNWWTADADALRDAMWHKAGHPVSISLKKDWASKEDTRLMLIKAGVGSAAARLPAVESEVRKANSYRTLIATVGPIFNSYGGAVTWASIDMALEFIKNFPAGSPTQVVPLPPGEIPTMFTGRDTREKMVAWIEAWCNRHAGFVALCFGFYSGLSDRAERYSDDAERVKDTLKTSYSLTGLVGASYASYINGRELHADYVTYKQKLRSAGGFEAPKYKAE